MIHPKNKVEKATAEILKTFIEASQEKHWVDDPNYFFVHDLLSACDETKTDRRAFLRYCGFTDEKEIKKILARYA
jgi:hypothetical protein